MDIASIIGIVAGIVFVIISILLGGGATALISFGDLPSVMITIGGSFAAILLSYSMEDFLAGLKSFTLVLKQKETNVQAIIEQIIEMSSLARKDGLLALEEAASESGDEFIKKGIFLIVDGTDPGLVRGILETELFSIETRHKSRVEFWQDIGAMGPAWGMIGTLIGLVNMLRDMEDPNTIGPAMSVALLTTLYGSMLANWIAIPTAKKLQRKSASELLEKNIMIEGLLSIQAGENPRVIEEKLKSFLSLTQRQSMNQGGEDNE